MAQYVTGTVVVTNGVSQVDGSSLAWLTAGIAAGDWFKISQEATAYQIASMASETELHLAANYAGSNQASADYQIAQDFTSNRGYGNIKTYDQDWPEWFNIQQSRIDNDMALLLAQEGVVTTLNVISTAVEVYAASKVKRGGVLQVYGSSQTNTIQFGDRVLIGPLDAPTILSTINVNSFSGIPPARTYTSTEGAIYLSVASGSFTTEAYKISH